MDSRAVRVSHRAAALRGVKPAHESDIWLARLLLLHFDAGSLTAKSLGLYRPGNYLLYHCVALVPAALARKSRRLRWLVLAALSLGFALATKPNGLVAALVIGLLFRL